MEALLESTLAFGLPLLLAAVAGIVAERTGVLNIGLEGFMLLGAFVSAWAAGGGGEPAIGVIAAMAAGAAIGFLFAIVVVGLRADQVAVGIAFNIMVLGGTTYGYALVTANGGSEALRVATAGQLDIPGLSSLPWIGVLFDQHWMAYLAIALALGCGYLLFRTGLGVRARACGEYSAGAGAAGINVVRWRTVATTTSCMLAALAGAYLVVADARQFGNDMTAGKGYIALAVIILARWNPLAAIPAALLFGGAQALDLQIQGDSILGVTVPGPLIQTLPYVVTIVAVTIVGRKVRPPAEEGKPLPSS